MLFEKVFEMNSLPSLLCRVRFAHTTKQTPRQKLALPTHHPKQEKSIREKKEQKNIIILWDRNLQLTKT